MILKIIRWLFETEQREVVRLPQSRMKDEELRRCLRVDAENGLLKGVREVVERMQLAALETIGDDAETTEARLAAGIRYDTGRLVLESLEAWRGEEG